MICPGFLVDLEQMDYTKAVLLQEEVRCRRVHGELPDTLILVEHPPVYTIGRSGGAEHIKFDMEALKQGGIGMHEVDRGGSITFHGYGQLVAYPIIHMDSFGGDLHKYLRLLEEVIIRTLQKFGISGCRFPPYTGVWVDREKIAAIGVACKGSVTTHGFALNVKTDLYYFSMINPCGIKDFGITSMAKLMPDALITMDRVKRSVQASFADVFSIWLTRASPEFLFRDLNAEHGFKISRKGIS